jgi:hypothetical protein
MLPIILHFPVQTGMPVYFVTVHAAHIQDAPAQPDMPIYFDVTQAAYIQDVPAQPDMPIYFGVTHAAYIQDVTAQPDMPIYFGVVLAAHIQGTDDALFSFQLPVSWLSPPFFCLRHNQRKRWVGGGQEKGDSVP